MSSSPIPGNEEAVGRIINRLYELDVDVFYPPTYKVHTSGHAYQEELKLILDLTRPKFFMPWHGEMRHQVNHKRIAETMSHPPEKILIPENGDILVLTKDSIKVEGQIESGALLLDNVGGKTGTEISEPIIRDRQMLSNDGIIVIMAIKGKQPSVEIINRGVVSDNSDLIKDIERISLEQLKKGSREKKRLGAIRDDIFYSVRRYVRKATRRNPIIVPTIIEG